MKIYKYLFIVLLLSSSCVRHSSRSGESFKNSAFKGDNQVVNRHSNNKTIIKMRNENGVYFVPISINDVNMEFIFDTGASDITISNVEAYFLLKQGKLTYEDILGSQQYQIADGSISVGTIINLKKVQIGNKTLYNVKASVVDNNIAPLLLGQTALTRFGKISIDYSKNQIEFD